MSGSLAPRVRASRSAEFPFSCVTQNRVHARAHAHDTNSPVRHRQERTGWVCCPSTGAQRISGWRSETPTKRVRQRQRGSVGASHFRRFHVRVPIPFSARPGPRAGGEYCLPAESVGAGASRRHDQEDGAQLRPSADSDPSPQVYHGRGDLDVARRVSRRTKHCLRLVRRSIHIAGSRRNGHAHYQWLGLRWTAAMVAGREVDRLRVGSVGV